MNKTALITGASNGLGREFAYIHAQKGGHLVLVARNKDKLNDIKKDIEEKYDVKVHVFAKDLTEENAATDIYNKVIWNNIYVDYLINNAGFGGVGVFYEQDLSQNIQMIKLNVIALTELTHVFVNYFVEKGKGKILQVSSVAAFMPGPMQAVYYATKAYVKSFSLAVSEEVKHKNISITTLFPGPTDTNFGKVSKMDQTSLFNHVADAEKVALNGYNGMIKGKRKVLSGINFSLKFLLKILPFVPTKIILKQVYQRQKIKR